MSLTSFLLLNLCCLAFINAGVVTDNNRHWHSIKPSSSEREKDGAYSPRDKDHLTPNGHKHEFDHEAILGSAKVSEEFDSLTKEESVRRLRILLTKMDLNRDQHIDQRELKAWILRSFRMLSEEEAQERMEDADANEDRKVSWQEYLADVYDLEDDNILVRDDDENADPELLQSLNDDKLMWEAADQNGDSLLEGNEWISFQHPEENPNMLPLILKQTLSHKDLDGDGAISFQEYIGDRALNHDKQWVLVEKFKFDKEFDKDKDGKLVGSEILSWIVPSNEDIAVEEVQHLFESSDDNHDELLSFDEVVNHHDIFVGSEVTDYGEHLHNIDRYKDEF